jgi:hypothetical protein
MESRPGDGPNFAPIMVPPVACITASFGVKKRTLFYLPHEARPLHPLIEEGLMERSRLMKTLAADPTPVLYALARARNKAVERRRNFKVQFGHG